VTAFRASSHFGLGANRRDLKAAKAGPRDWVIGQLGEKHNVVIPGLLASQELLQDYLVAQQQRRMEKRTPSDESQTEDRKQNLRRRSQRRAAENIMTRFAQSVDSRSPVLERLALFWSNHFTVSRARQPQIATACCAFENETIRQSLHGHFAEMLIRVTSHPVMLLYLDNARSIGPNSPVGKRRTAGLNENLARELLELHTLGVEGGYLQKDVKALARILTGWTVGTPANRRFGGETGHFSFVAAIHEPGRQHLLGKRYKDRGFDQGVDALRDLSLHPATAKHVATSLVRHFVADDPDDRDIERIERVYLETDGHLPSIHRAVVNLDSAWLKSNKKFKTPYELLVSMYRGLEVSRRPDNIVSLLGTMNHMPFSAPSPAGWPDTTAHWGTPAALKQRIELGVAIGQRLGNRLQAQRAAQVLVDSPDSSALLTSLKRAASPTQALSLLLASPEFQWR
jgi:uncharacterized protein (DUF1800 family)